MTKFFGKTELLVFLGTILAIILISVGGFLVSFRRARDETRRVDISSIAGAVNKFRDEYGFYPLSSANGKIQACLGKDTYIVRRFKIFTDPVECEWGKDSLSLDPTDVSFTKLFDTLPRDPKASDGLSYIYVSNGEAFAIYAHLEGKSEPEYDPKILKLNIKCGNEVCNAGKASAGSPLDKPLGR